MRQTRKTQKPTENERRAGNAQDALIVFARHTGLNLNTDGMETVVVDFLADLRHLCDSYGLNLARILRIASSHYAVETTSADDPQQFAAEAESESGHTFATTDDLIAFVEDLDGYGLTVSDSELLARSIKHDAPGTDQPKIIVEVSGGVAYCDDPRVQIIDHDDQEDEPAEPSAVEDGYTGDGFTHQADEDAAAEDAAQRASLPALS